MPKKGGKGKLDRPLSHVPRVPTCAQVTYNVGHCHTLSSQILSESLAFVAYPLDSRPHSVIVSLILFRQAYASFKITIARVALQRVKKRIERQSG